MVSENEIAFAAERAKRGDREALSQLVELLRAPLFAVAYGELRHYEDAQDAVAATLLRACQHIHELKDTSSLRAWIQQIARNEARRIRQSKPPPAPYDTALAPSDDATPGILRRLDIEDALRRLPYDQARTLHLFYFDALSIGEIACRVNRPEGTIKYWLHQGRQNLASEMKGYAPMTTPETALTATIISTNIAPQRLSEMSQALRNAGWQTVHFISDFAEAGRLDQVGTTEKPLFGLNAALRASQCIVIDEWIGGRSAFELLPLLRTTENHEKALFLLVDNAEENPTFDMTVRAAYVSGVDMLLSKPFLTDEFESFCKQIRLSLKKR